MAVRHLIVKLTANTDAMSAGLRKGQQEVNSFSKGVGSLGSIVTKAGAAFGVAFGAQAIIGGITDRIQAIDDLGDAAERLNIDPRMLVGLGHAADLSGSSAETLTASIEKMNRIISEAAVVGGPAAQMIERIGLDAKELDALSADEAFYAISEAIAAIPDAGQQAAAAVKLFGKQGAELVPMLRTGKDGLAAFQAEAERLGIALDADDIARISDVNDELERSKKAFQGLGNEAVVALAGPTEWLLDMTTGYSLAAKNIFQLGKAGYANLQGNVEEYNRLMDEAGKTARAAADEFTGNDNTALEIAEKLRESEEARRQEAERIAAAQEKALAAMRGQADALDKALGKLPTDLGGGLGLGFRALLGSQLDTLAGLEVSVPDALRSQVEMVGLSDSQKRLQEFADSIQLAISPALTVEQALEFPDERVQAVGRFVAALERGAEWAEGIAKAQEDAAEAMAQSEQWARQAYQIQLGLTDREMQIEDARRKGVGEDELDQMKLASKMIDRAELIAESRKLEEQFASPEIQMQEFADRLSQMISEGLSPEAAQAAFRAKLDDMNVREREVDAPELKRAGSQEAYSAILKYRESQEAKTPEWAIKMNEWLEKIAAATAQEAEQAPAKAENLF